MPLTKRDKVELAVAAVIVLVYVGGTATGYLQTNDVLFHALVIAGAVAIFGDNFLKVYRGGDN